jgi:uncharacterized protein YPO0396
MWSKGYAAEETKLAFTRAIKLAADVDDPAERRKRDARRFKLGDRDRGNLPARNAERDSNAVRSSRTPAGKQVRFKTIATRVR